MNRFAIYARSATSQELGSSFALAEQVHQCIEFATEQGYEPVAGQIYEEVFSGNSPTTPPQLEKILKCAKEGLFDVLIIRSYDRLSRRWDRIAVLVSTLQGYGVEVISLSEPEANGEVRRSMSQMIIALHTAFQSLEREHLITRMQKGKQAKRRRLSDQSY